MKEVRLKFAGELPKLILEGKKDTTWRINDEKNIEEGDVLILISTESLKEFGKANVIKVNNTTFKNLNYNDKEGHEKFITEEEMYETYSKYYNTKIIPETKVKVITFKLL